MKTILHKTTIFTLLLAYCSSNSQTIVYSEYFTGTHNWSLNVPTGINNSTPNVWVVNANEGGVTPPGCGIANNGNNTLYVTCTSMFCGSFITGAVYNASITSNTRAESPSFSTVGFTNLSLKFNFISIGDGLNDNASLLYDDGTGWQVLVNSFKSPICGGGQGKWTEYSIDLPISAENNPNFKIAFNWTNNNDNIGSDPSIAVDDVIISSSILSSSEFDLKSQVKIYPNPSKGILKIESEFNDVFSIVNQLGQEVKKFNIISNTINEINIEELENGIYFLRNNQSSIIEKIIKE
jgi:hypothetical protein